MGGIKDIFATQPLIRNSNIPDNLEAEVDSTCKTDQACRDSATNSATALEYELNSIAVDEAKKNQFIEEARSCAESLHALANNTVGVDVGCNVLGKKFNVPQWGISADAKADTTTPSTELPEKVKTVYDAIDVAVSLEPFDGTLALDSLQTNVNDVATFLYGDDAQLKDAFAQAVTRAKSSTDPAEVKAFLETLKLLIDTRTEQVPAGQAEGEKEEAKNEETNATEGGENPPIDLGGGAAADGKYTTFVDFSAEIDMRGPTTFEPGGDAATGSGIRDELGYLGVNNGRDVGLSGRFKFDFPIIGTEVSEGHAIEFGGRAAYSVGNLMTVPVDRNRTEIDLTRNAIVVGPAFRYHYGTGDKGILTVIGALGIGGSWYRDNKEDAVYAMGGGFNEPTDLDKTNYFNKAQLALNAALSVVLRPHEKVNLGAEFGYDGDPVPYYLKDQNGESATVNSSGGAIYGGFFLGFSIPVKEF